MTIKIGDIVRSFDFMSRDITGDRACYVEGKCLGIDSTHFDCPRYVIAVTRRVFGGEVIDVGLDAVVYPPVNGTPTWLGAVTEGVVLIREASVALEANRFF